MMQHGLNNRIGIEVFSFNQELPHDSSKKLYTGLQGDVDSASKLHLCITPKLKIEFLAQSGSASHDLTDFFKLTRFGLSYVI
jgi:hypothetical protein